MDNGEILKLILNELKDLKQGQANIELRLVNLEQNVANIELRLVNLEQNVANLEKGQANIELRLVNLEQNVANLEKGQANIELRLANLEKGQANIELRLANLEQNVANLEQLIIDTKESVIIIENDHGKQIGVLFDGQGRIHDMVEEILVTVHDMQVKLEKHDVEIAVLSLPD